MNNEISEIKEKLLEIEDKLIKYGLEEKKERDKKDKISEKILKDNSPNSFIGLKTDIEEFKSKYFHTFYIERDERKAISQFIKEILPLKNKSQEIEFLGSDGKICLTIREKGIYYRDDYMTNRKMIKEYGRGNDYYVFKDDTILNAVINSCKEEDKERAFNIFSYLNRKYKYSDNRTDFKIPTFTKEINRSEKMLNSDEDKIDDVFVKEMIIDSDKVIKFIDKNGEVISLDLDRSYMKDSLYLILSFHNEIIEGLKHIFNSYTDYQLKNNPNEELYKRGLARYLVANEL